MWRYWRDLPPKGDIAVVFGSWYNDPVREFVLGALDELAFERELARINRFELMLANHGALILKLWFHLAYDAQKKRLRKVRSTPGAGRHVLEEWSGFAHHKDLVRAGEKIALDQHRLCAVGGDPERRCSVPRPDHGADHRAGHAPTA